MTIGAWTIMQIGCGVADFPAREWVLLRCCTRRRAETGYWCGGALTMRSASMVTSAPTRNGFRKRVRGLADSSPLPILAARSR